jgi:hypothetical protein
MQCRLDARCGVRTQKKRKDGTMRTSHPMLLAFVTAGSLLLQPAIAPSVSADGSHRTTVPVSFTQYSGSDPPGWVQADHPTEWWCVDLHNVTIYGSGTKTIVTTEQTMPDGSTHEEINTTVNGTARDDANGTYHFDYHNHASVNTPPGGPPVQVRMTDGYNLVGNGGVNNLHTHFQADFTAASADPETWAYNPMKVHGTPFNCDPI